MHPHFKQSGMNCSDTGHLPQEGFLGGVGTSAPVGSAGLETPNESSPSQFSLLCGRSWFPAVAGRGGWEGKGNKQVRISPGPSYLLLNPGWFWKVMPPAYHPPHPCPQQALNFGRRIPWSPTKGTKFLPSETLVRRL